jgi:H+-transporting ATPase
MNQNTISTEDAKQISINELFQKFASSPVGLSTSEVEQRLQKYGYNEFPEKKVNPIVKFSSYFWGPIPWMIEIAAILSAIIQQWDDFWIIFSLLMINAIVGFWQEHKAGNAIELLKQKLALKARVLRDNKWHEISASELVPGDFVRVRLGEIIPADIKLATGEYLQIDESALTGESLPVEKHPSDVAYSGSIVKQGEMDALVVSTGLKTYFGKTVRLVEEAQTQSHFQKAVIKIGDYLIAIAVALVSVVILVALFRHASLLQTIQFSLVLIVAAIPAALPAVLSVTMAVGAIVLAKKEAIVSKLVAIEEMAGMDVLCADKTGTITKNEISVAEVKSFAEFTENDVLLFGTLASREEDQDPIDIAISSQANNIDMIRETLDRYQVTAFKPFDPVAKRTEATLETINGSFFKVAKGAPQVILALASNKETMATEVNEIVDTFAEKGYRALGVARTTDASDNWQFVGMFALHDPPREDSAETITTAQAMGVDVKMVTGDHEAVAKEIAHQVNLKTNIMSPSSFLDKSDREGQTIVENADGFAEVFPEHKYHIVELLQGKGHIVGMTGDGVNDAPALKKADAGIAVAGATDAAKSAADIVLTLPGLSVIIDAIKESRKIFQRMNSYAIYRIAETMRVLFFLTLSILIFNFYPLTAVMIVILALLNDIPIMMIAYDNTKLLETPVHWEMHKVLTIATVLGALGVFFSFMLFWIGEEVLYLSPQTIQTLIFLKMTVGGHLTLYIARTGEHSFWKRPLPATRLFLATELTQVVGTLFAIYGIFMNPLGWQLALFVWGYALGAFLITNFVNNRSYKLVDHVDIKFHR